MARLGMEAWAAAMMMGQLVFAITMVLNHEAAEASDPALQTDFGLTTATSGANFTFKGFEHPPGPQAAGKAVVTPAFVAQFPGLAGLSISGAFFSLSGGGVVAPHTHPRASEFFYVISGNFTVGFVDSNNVLYKANLVPGDVFVFPQALVHYQMATSYSATGVSGFNSANPGVAMAAKGLFASKPMIDDTVLAPAFATNASFIEQLKAGVFSQQP